MNTDTKDPAYLADLRRRGAEYNDKLRAKGIKLVTYRLPCCLAQSESRVQPPGETQAWDTLATCEHCGALYLKITQGEKVSTMIPPAA